MDLGFELVGGFVSEGRVFAADVVVAFDGFEDFGLGIGGVFKPAVLKHFELERSDEGFGLGVVAEVGPGGHTLVHGGRGQGPSEGRAAVLPAVLSFLMISSGVCLFLSMRIRRRFRATSHNSWISF